ncbi:DUF72 domain-containing protein [Hufsiella ginkgonis]|uniref:DUF72 domain-containing protein n=1 Tax=Hufsiella ginkgonis TaxID=2695274 RepID=A0A7K1XYN4_9SPHI|nr:DUF72 domain-containing protein [Hufsiella ginkgonis]MXV16105.1 DUF72 domain-containing protein [Hufsiella ginkgonis]
MDNDQEVNYYSGTSGLVLPVPNKLSYPPEFRDKTRLTYYASLFNSIEINSSFYKVPMGSTMRKWATEVPAGFRFSFKLWREITHQKELVYDPDEVARFMSVINNVGEKKGSLLVQFPPSITSYYARQVGNLVRLIRAADPGNEWQTALEFRSRSWYQPETYDLLDEYGMGLVLHDMPASGTSFQELHAPFTYLRFHGLAGDYRGGYPDDMLYEYAQYIRDWLAAGRTVYTYFNNTVGDAVKDLAKLNSYVTAG